MASTGDDYYASSFEDLRSMGCDGAALQVLREGLAAHPTSALLLKLASREGLEVPRTPAPAQASPWAGPFTTSPAAPAAPSAVATPAPSALAARPAEWKPPPAVNTGLQRDGGSKAVKALREAQAAQAAFAEADCASWAAKRARASNSTEELRAEEWRLRSAAIKAFEACKADLKRFHLQLRTELLRPPSTPDIFSNTYEAWRRSGPEGALREEIAREAPSAFSSADAWDAEGPGAFLKLSRLMSDGEALLARARELAQTGPGTVHGLLNAIAHETAAVVSSLPAGAARVLVIGGHGAAAVTALRAGATTVVVWETQHFVACATREVLRRNLTAELVSRCSVEEGERPPSGAWDLLVVDLWHGTGALAWGAVEALRLVVASTGPGGIARVIPSKVVVSVALADARLTSASGFDLSRLDARFRSLSVTPLRIAQPEDADAHPTALRPTLLTDGATAFELDLGRPEALAAEDGPVALQLRGLRPGIATVAVTYLTFHLRPNASADNLALMHFAQWMPGGLAIAEGEEILCASVRRGSGRIWVDWDWGRAEEPPFGYMGLSDWYFEMLRDGARHELYDRALHAEITAVRSRGGGCRVLDVGSGDGILSMMALRAGASAAVGVEVVEPIARISEEIVAVNRQGAGGNAEPLPGVEAAPLEIWCTDIRGVSAPPDDLKFDLLVSELMDASGLGENLVLLTRGARERLCVAGAPVLPARLRLQAVLCELRLPELAGVSLDAFRPFWPAERLEETLWTGVDLDKREGNFRVLSDPAELLSLDLGHADVNAVPARKDLEFAATADGTANCVVWWFEAQLSTVDPSIVLTNAPKCVDARHAATCWGQAMAELASPVHVASGKPVGIIMEVPFGDYQLKFRPRVAADARGANSASACSLRSPSLGTLPYSEAFVNDMKAYHDLRMEMKSTIRSTRIGRSAVAAADVGALGALQRCAICIASQPYLFGVEVSIASKMLTGWYAVGGEGRT